MGELGREEFVSGTYESQAYADGPLPIGCGQTISQPYIVALMTQELWLDGNCTVLEIGTGCGYQTAVLSRLAKKVYTVERFGQLSESAQATLGRLGVENVEFFVGDGSSGWPEKKIFDRIMVTAAVPAVPEPLLEQLATGGLMVAPVGGQSVQRLIVCEKKTVGVVEKAICDVRFVRLIGEYGFGE
jgi:protein-L-isoaspartate(D-aspartate) O-methyltransferase